MRIIAIFLIILIALNWLGRLVFRLGGQTAGTRGQQQRRYGQQPGAGYSNGGNSGKVNIQYVRRQEAKEKRKRPHTKDGAGEYIDYEELD